MSSLVPAPPCCASTPVTASGWRQTWRIVHGKLAYRSAACVTQSWILWRRLGGGLSAGQQQAVANPLLAPIRGLHRRMTGGGGRGSDTSLLPRESAEVWRLLGSLELLPAGTKIELGQMTLDLLAKKDVVIARLREELERAEAKVRHQRAQLHRSSPCAR